MGLRRRWGWEEVGLGGGGAGRRWGWEEVVGLKGGGGGGAIEFLTTYSVLSALLQ